MNRNGYSKDDINERKLCKHHGENGNKDIDEFYLRDFIAIF